MAFNTMKAGLMVALLAATTGLAPASAAGDEFPTPCGFDDGLPLGVGNPLLRTGDEPCESGEATAVGACSLRLLGAPSVPILTPEDHRSATQIMDLLCVDPDYVILDPDVSVSAPYVVDVSQTWNGLLNTGIGNSNPVLPGTVSFMRLPVLGLCAGQFQCNVIGGGPNGPNVADINLNADARWSVMVNNLSSFRFRVCVDVVITESTTMTDVNVTACIQYGQWH